MHSKPARLALLSALILPLAASAQDHKYDVWEENYAVQALLGAVRFGDLKFVPKDAAAGETEEVDISTMPYLGGAWSTLPKGGDFQIGLEATALLGFRFDDINYLYLGGGGAYVSLSTSLWLFDISGGAYANLFLGEGDRVRLYVAGGPLMMFAAYDEERNYKDPIEEDTDDSASAFGVGLYARTGIEVRIHRKGMLGLGVRGSWSSVDLSDYVEESNLTGLAAFITYTAGF